MALEKTIARLDDYYARLKSDKAARIKVRHVEKVILKLEAQQEALRKDLEKATKPSKRARLEAKLKIVHDQMARARWLRKQITKSE